MAEVTQRSVRRVIGRMRRTRDSAEFRRLSGALAHITDQRTRGTIAAVLLIEMTERPRRVRAIEWLLHDLSKIVPTRTTLGPRTLGPLQLQHAPRDFRRAASRAGEMLQSAESDIVVAQRWYGSAARQQGSCVSYVEALHLARRLLAEGLGG